MWKNYLKVGLRNFLRNKNHTLLNITGLTAGVTACLLIAAYVWHEYQYDGFHEKGSQIYRLNTDLNFPEQTLALALAAGPAGPAMKEEIPGVMDFVRFARPENSVLVASESEKRYEEAVLYADASIFSIFDFQLLHGNPLSVLEAPYQLVLTESKAKTWFGELSPIGASLEVAGREYQVAGIVADPPKNSHLQFDMLLSFASWIVEKPYTQTNWGWTPFPSYILLEEGVDYQRVNQQLEAFIGQHFPQDENNMHMGAHLQPLEAIHFGESRLGELQPVSKKSGLLFLSLVAGFILLLAVANYINLSLAAFTRRTREIGVRKTIGASSSQVGLQYIMEGILLSLVSVVLATVFAIFLLPIFGNWYGRDLYFETTQLWGVGSLLVLFAIFLGILTAAYPSILAGSLKPIQILRRKGAVNRDSLKIQRAFSVAQFSISIGLLLGAMMVYLQLDYLQNKDLGFNKEGKVVIDFGNVEALGLTYQTVSAELLAIPGVSGISFSSHVPAQNPHNVTAYISKTDGEQVFGEMDLILVDEDFLDLYDLELISGRAFSNQFSQDTAGALILSESAVKLLGFQHPDEVIGLEFSQWEWQGRVVGVVEDFNFHSLHQQPGPITFQWQPSLYEKMTVQLNASDLSKTLNLLENKWSSILPNLPFQYHFLDEGLERQYVADRQLGRMISVSSMLAILLACLGLIGLVAYTCRRQAKNIAIRKVFGASGSLIIKGLLLQFGKPVLWAWFFAIGPTWWLLNRWLDGFAYRLSIPIWLIFASGLIVFLLVSGVVIWQSQNTVKANPVKYLGEE